VNITARSTHLKTAVVELIDSDNGGAAYDLGARKKLAFIEARNQIEESIARIFAPN
jgi:hypothetical protein